MTPPELIDLPLNGGQIAGARGARGETLSQDLGATRDLTDFVLGAIGFRPGGGQSPCGDGGVAPVGVQAPDNSLDTLQDRQVGPFMTQTGESGIEVLQVDEETLLTERGVRHGGVLRWLGIEFWAVGHSLTSRCSDVRSTDR